MNILTENKIIVNAKYLEEIFTDMQINKTDLKSNLESIKKILNSSFDDAVCDDVFCKPNTTLSKDFIGMCVYPSQNSLMAIAEEIVKKNNTKEMTKLILKSKIHYSVEIDWQLIDNKIYNFKPDELVAMLLHEIGHVTADTDFYCDLLSSYQKAMFQLSKNDELLDKKYDRKEIYIAMIYVISGINATKLEKNDYNTVLQKEQLADKFVVDNGYGKSLVSAMNKINKNFLNKKSSMYSNSSKTELDNQAEMFFEMNKMFNQRRKYVISLLDNEIKVNKSNIIKNLITKIKDKLKGEVVIHEGVIYDKSFLQESFIDNFKRSPLKVSQCDIDELTIEKEMMEDWDDKSILVYKIHKRIAQLEKTRRENKDKSLDIIINNYMKQLQDLLKETMKFKAVQKSYGVFVKYPKGYEG